MRQETVEGRGNWVDSVTQTPPAASVRDATGGNDKSWTVPGNELWKVTRLCINYTSSAVVGNRVCRIVEQDGDGNARQSLPAGAVQAAGATVEYCCAQGVFRETTVTNGSIHVPVPSDFYIPAGHVLRVHDREDISDADQMIVSFQYFKLRV